MSEYIYIQQNNDWDYEEKYKFGYTQNPLQRIKNSHEQHSHISIYKMLFKIEKTDKYNLGYKEYDKIIYKPHQEYLKNKYKCNFDNLLNIKKYIVKNGGSQEFIYKDGLEIFKNILFQDFNILGLNVDIIDVSSINNEIIQFYKNITQAISEDVISEDIICEDVICEDVISEDIICEDIICEDVISEDVIIKPHNYQKDILDKIDHYYKHNNNGKLIWACGMGKTLMTLLIIKHMNYNSVIIGVPSINLQKQWADNILKLYNIDNILFVGGNADNYKNIKAISSDNYDIINNKLNLSKKSKSPIFVITTYHSSNILVDKKLSFDFKVGDEAHHLVGIENENNKGFRKFHKIISNKGLYLTATEKIIEKDNYDNISKYSMNDEDIFGKYIDVKSIKWAIENNKITDYKILVIKNTIDEVESIIKSLNIKVSDKNIFISCYMCLKSLEKYDDLTHILLYTNSVKEAEQAKKYIDDILSLDIISINKDKIYNNALHSNNEKTNNYLDKEIKKFKNMPFGIISCIYIFGEGFDMPKLNGVCITGNMKSIIRIIQYLLRANRLEIGNPLKIAYQIIPYIDSNDWLGENNNSYDNIKYIISQMRNEDDNIEQKIKVLTQEYINKEEDSKKLTQIYYSNFNENDNELSKLKLRLRYSKSLHSNFTEEEDEYNYVRSINISLNIKSKYDYINSEDKHANFISNPENYFKSKGVWINWYHFYGNDTNNYVSKDILIKICKENNVRSSEDYIKLCETHEELPKEPAEYYKDFTNLKNELGLFNRRK